MKRETFTIDQKTMEQLREYCEKTGMKMSVVVRRGIGLFLYRESKKEQNGKDDD